MLNIINNLKPFFEDCYGRINVREYARIIKISPPTASKILLELNKEGLLLMENDKNYRAESCWLNLEFPSLNGTLHLTYHPLNGDINEYLEETNELASKHQIKASGIEEKLVFRDSSKVYGLIYEIGGNAASSIQFFLTDSTKHFIRGALYFNVAPNTDSIAPVVDFVRKDIYHMIETFEWKNAERITSSQPSK